MWEFNKDVANRFQHEASSHIPDYDRVINLCYEIVDNNYPKTVKIADVGSALGHTLHKFISKGYTNITGIETSDAMIERSLHNDKVIKSEVFVGEYDVVLMNWTLHFIKDKFKYVEKIYDNLNKGGILILTDKMNQSPIVKELYYNFKRDNGVTDAYIQEKEKQLVGYMHTEDISTYLANLRWIGFRVEVINASHGFVTYYCQK